MNAIIRYFNPKVSWKLMLPIFVFISWESRAQVVLKEQLTGNTVLAAPKSIILKPGFSTNGNEFHAYIDESACYNYTATPSQGQNYVQVIVPTVAVSGESAPLAGTVLCTNDIDETVQYFDGLGRVVQTISVAASPEFNNAITPVEYDDFGRVAKEYLPFIQPGSEEGQAGFVPDQIVKQEEFYNQSAYYPADKDYAFTLKEFENSPLNRVAALTGPGAAWHTNNKSQKFTYGANTVPIPMAKMTTTTKQIGEASVVVPAVKFAGEASMQYAANQLHVNTILDEDNRKMEEYINKSGQVIMKKSYISETDAATTYYVYDDFDQLRFVLSPQAYEAILPTLDAGNTIVLHQDHDIIKNLGYYYEYDARRRMVVKQISGADHVDMIYDKRDRLAMSQDGNQRINDEWTFTKYDRHNRPVMTGIVRSGKSKTTIQNEVNAKTGNNLYEDRTGTVANWTGNTSLFGHTNRAYPTTTNTGGESSYTNITVDQVNKVICYDDYSFTDKTYTTLGAESYFTGFPSSAESNVKGRVTGEKERVLKPSGALLSTPTWLETVYFYDDKGRVIQTISDNIMGGQEVISHAYDFVGKVLKTHIKNTIPGKTDVVLRKRFEYDHTGRLLRVYNHLENGGGEVLTVEYQYDELGRQTEKSLHKSGSNVQQSVDYKYNIRGWLTDINNPSSLSTAGETYSDLFAMKLEYENLVYILGNFVGDYEYYNPTAQYSGNIGAVTSRVSGQPMIGWAYLYDGMNRLTEAGLTDGTSALFGSGVSEYNYDKNGNFTSLYRRNANSITSYDNLQYRYYTGTNQLKNVSDASNSAQGYCCGPSTVSAVNYTYDANGNMVTDANKGLSSISYNHLNLPGKVQFSASATASLQYYYTAGSDKKAKYYRNNSGGVTTDYHQGSFVYNAAKNLNYIRTEEGRILRSGSSYFHEYTLSDHLGNVRVSFRATGSGPSLLQRDDYTPFGLTFNSLTPSSPNQYKFNGVEFNPPTERYETLFRGYDPELGRFLEIDPLAGVIPGISGYHFGFNNPVRFRDPLGLMGETDIFGRDRYDEFSGMYVPPYLREGGTACIGCGDLSKGSWEPIVETEFVLDQSTHADQNDDGTFKYNKYRYTPTTRIIGRRWVFSDFERYNNISLFLGDSREPYTGFLGSLEYIWTGGNENGIHYDWGGNPTGFAPITGTDPGFIGGPLRKGQQAIKLGKYLFNPQYFHRAFKPDILKRAGDFSKIVGKNPDIGLDGTKIILNGAKNGPFKGKTYQTGLNIWDFIF